MAFYLRPVIASPRYCAPAFFSRPTPSFPTPHDIAPLFSLFDETFAQLERAHRQVQSRAHFKRPLNPKFDVKETKEAYTLEGELPGFDPKDLSIEFLDDGHTLQIKGKTVSVKESRQQAKAVEASQSEAEAPKAVGAAPAPAESKSETSSVKSHQPTVEDADDTEEPANASAVSQSEQAQPQPQQQQTQTVAEPSKTAEQQQQQDEPKHWISERYTGSFSRSFQFPSKVNQEAVRASLKDGILAITLPFARKPESRRIQIE
ncbi:hypothetical protein OHC33_007326 [Knufia fluminis]|uniref:SHSP domain-containing protein n=1 Tax=Knufia fluminis TaxID=191047 RepID=A0AAN8I2P0_9EURO|nr:hypothetical protein OHC33_007326 [Knufia fluminis]